MCYRFSMYWCSELNFNAVLRSRVDILAARYLVVTQPCLDVIIQRSASEAPPCHWHDKRSKSKVSYRVGVGNMHIDRS